LIPVRVNDEDTLESLRDKVKRLSEDIYKKFELIDTDVYDFVSESPIQQQVISSVEADVPSESAPVTFHARSHAIDSTDDHTSTITENNLMDADANGLPDDSGIAVSNVLLKTGGTMTGDLLWTGTGTGLAYGNCYGNEIAWTQASAVQNTYYDIADSDMATGYLNNVTHDGNGKLTVTEPGMYLCVWYASLEANGANVHLQMAISVNGTEIADGSNHFETFGVSNQSPVSGTAILDLADNATVNLSVRTTDAGGPDLTIDHLGFSLVQIGGT